MQEQIRPVANIDLVERDLADIRNILTNRVQRENQNRQGFQGNHNLSKDEIKKALQPQKYEDIKTNAKECPICYQAFGKEQELQRVNSPVCQLKCHQDHVFHVECLSQFIYVCSLE